MLLGAGCKEPYDFTHEAAIGITIVQQPVGGTNLDQLTCTFRVDRTNPPPGQQLYNRPTIPIQLVWYTALSPLGAVATGNPRYSDLFVFDTVRIEEVFTSTYEYPYADSAGALMEGVVRIFWTDATGEHSLDSNHFTFRFGT